MKTGWICSVIVAAASQSALFVVAQQTPSNAAGDLGGTSWQLVKFQGGDDKTLTPDEKSNYTIAFERDGNVSARMELAIEAAESGSRPARISSNWPSRTYTGHVSTLSAE